MWSEYQSKVFDFFQNGSGHGAVNAVAGSGKSTTAVEAVIRAKVPNTQILAFNKHIEVDFNAKLEERGEVPLAKTYNAFAWGIFRQNARTKLDRDKTQNILRYQVLGKGKENEYWKFWSPMKRVIGILKNNFIDPRKPKVDLEKIILEYIDEYDIDLKSSDVMKFVNYAFQTYMISTQTLDVSDFDDQKFQPVYREMEFPKVDLAVVDEYQDTCPLEGKILELIRPDRLIVFGDPWQAIYSFKGTSKDSLAEFLTKYNATELPLSICYRCPKEVVRHAQGIVKHMEYNPEAPEGEVQTIEHSSYVSNGPTYDDMVLARCNVDLVSSAMGFIRRNIPAFVRGKEVGDQLTNIIKRVTNGKSMHISDFTPAFLDYQSKEIESLKGRNAVTRLSMFEETCETISVVSESCTTTDAILARLKTLFSDDANCQGIMHQSIHKSKGGEGKTGKDVYIIRPDKIPHPKAQNLDEERRIHYVGMTRVKGNGKLIYVRKPDDK